MKAAQAAALKAHAPYSGFKVGAAVIDERGRIHVGANIESASYGLTLCAERLAIFTAIAAGAKRITGIAVTARSLKPVMPCGACRQIMVEFAAPQTVVELDEGRGRSLLRTVDALMPESFSASSLPEGGSALDPGKS